MTLLLVLLFITIQTASPWQYVKDIDDCIGNGVNLAPESTITQSNLTNRVCGFLMQANQYIVVQPRVINIHPDARIRLYMLSTSNNQIVKTLIHEYYARNMFRQLVFIGAGFQRFALVVLSRTNMNDVGQFEFLYKTNCSVNLIAEDAPNFMTPNYLPYNYQLNNLFINDSQSSQACSYRISSRNRSPFAIRFPFFNLYWTYTLIINNVYISSATRLEFNGTETVTIEYSRPYQQNSNIMGFSAFAESTLETVKLKPVDGRNNSGIVQISYLGKTYSLQYRSLTDMDLQIICINLNFGEIESAQRYENTTGLSLLSHDFQCTGNERLLSQCISLSPHELHSNSYYNENPAATVVTCKDHFPVRLVHGSNSSGFVEVRVAKEWGKICYDNMDASVPDVLCREMGFNGALDAKPYRGNSSTPGYYDHPNGEYYQIAYSVIMNNVRCGNQRRLKDCSYQIGRNQESMNMESRERQRTVNYQIYYQSSNMHCGTGFINLICGSTKSFSLMPGHHEGYLRYNEHLVCQSSYDMNNAAVFCRFFGYPGIRKIYQNSSFATSQYEVINLQCNGNENSPADCSIGPARHCSSASPMGIICQDVALAGSNNVNEGRVEVYYNGRRGLLCDDYFDMNSGNVICRQLGFGRVKSVTLGATQYGSGNGVFLLDDLQCSGNESSIHQCPNKSFVRHDCGATEVSGLICSYRNESCGTPYVPESFNKSTNGFETVFGANPWQARLIPNNENEWCSATILNNNWLLTSANCFGSASSNFYITVGSSEYNWNSANWALSHGIQKVVQHPKYSSVTGDYNIALVKVNIPMEFSGLVEPICLESGYPSLSYQQCWTTGWNHRQSSTYRPLMGKIVELLSNTSCMQYTYFDGNRMSRYLCSLNNMEESAIFNGESGGPLICSVNGKNILVGVVSRSVQGARSTNIRLFSRVNSYSDWINNVMTTY